MKKLLCLSLALAMILGLCACGNSTESQSTQPATQAITTEPQATEPENVLQAGFSRIAIMPNGTFHLGGTDSSKRRTDQVLDQVSVTCIALKDNEKTVLVYTMDLLNAYDSCIDPAKASISGNTGIPQENILMNATHTHSGVGIDGSWDGAEEYRITFTNATVSAALGAIADLAPVEVYYGDVQTEGLAFVRHYELDNGTFAGSNFGDFNSGTIVGHAAQADQLLQIVRFERTEKKDIILMNFPAHPTFNGQVTDLWLSADYPGAARQHVELNGDYQVAFFLGGAGNQTATSRIKGESPVASDDYKAHGQLLGDHVINALPSLTKVEDTTMKLLNQVYTGASCKEGIEKLPAAGTVIAAAKEYGNLDSKTIAIARENGFASYFEANSVKSRSGYPATFSMDLHALTIGDLGFVFAPFEMFGSQSMRLREISPCENTFVVTCSEGAQGYLPDLQGFEMGCYEFCVTRYERGTAEKVTDTFVQMLTTLKEQ